MDRHADFLASLSEEAIGNIPLESVFIAFSYLKHSVVSRENDRENAVDETLFPDEIRLLKSLQNHMDYSTHLKDMIKTSLQDTYEDLTQRDWLLENIDRWPKLDRETQQHSGSSFVYIFNYIAAERFNLPFEHVAFNIFDEYDPAQSFAMLHYSADYAKNKEPYILWNPDPDSIADPAVFFSSASHEKGHNLLWQLGRFQHWQHELPEPLKHDAEISRLSRKYSIGGFLGPIQSVYYSNPEEALCHEIGDILSQKLEALITQRAALKAHPRPQEEIRLEP